MIYVSFAAGVSLNCVVNRDVIVLLVGQRARLFGVLGLRAVANTGRPRLAFLPRRLLVPGQLS